MSIFSSIADAIAGSRADAAMLQPPPLGVGVPAGTAHALSRRLSPQLTLRGASYQPITRQQVEEIFCKPCLNNAEASSTGRNEISST